VSLPPKSTSGPRSAHIRDERGVALVIYTLAMIPMLGMLALVADMGVEFARKAAMQSAADAAALAAAPLLGTTNVPTLNQARDNAKAAAAANGYTLADADIVISTTSATNDTVTIVHSHTDQLIFARALGINQATPGVLAKAQVGALVGGKGVMPFGLEDGPLVYGQTYCLKADSNGPCSGIALQGNFRALDIDVGDSGATDYRNDIVDGADTLLKVGDIREVETGNMAGPTRQGVGCDGSSGRLTGNTQTFEQVFHLEASGTYSVLDWDSPRLVLIPVVSYPSAHTAQILKFVGFYLENCSGNGNSASVTGRFVSFIYADSDTRWAPLGNSTDTGLRTIRLVG
jgi:Flp pilus assembly protein TadG